MATIHSAPIQWQYSWTPAAVFPGPLGLVSVSAVRRERKEAKWYTWEECASSCLSYTSALGNTDIIHLTLNAVTS